ncbi:FAR1-related sequence 7 isoform 1 [Theobroma cacao]|uniref:Protein FAR1-RELATED SEQUENCE n=2 Tax=Theobroma cacao TaxID=3641 RepID=A0A061ENQ5_THECC|nr:FAR1-related sequence 7 isoform 1 [Theobroma cacao]
MGIDSGSSHFTDFKSSDINANSGECVNAMFVKAYPVGMVHMLNNGNVEDEGESRMEPYVGLEFDSADEAREFYGQYAIRVGFKIRTGQLYRSRTDGSVSSRRFVCSKEGFQLNSRTGCPAFIRVQRRDSGKWLIDQIQKDHNHELGPVGESHSPILQQTPPVVTKSLVEVLRRPKVKLLEEIDNGGLIPSGIINFKRHKRGGDGGQSIAEPYTGLEFNSANEAYGYYQAYAEGAGFRVRIGQLFRSKNDGSITSRRFVCSKEGFQHPSRVGCGAYMRIKRKDSGTWIVDRLHKDHNHDLEVHAVYQRKFSTASKKLLEEEAGGLASMDLVEVNNGKLVKRRQENKIGAEWYSVLFEYFQTRQAEDTGFFYSVDVDNGSCMSVFWADGRSRFSCSQFGDVIVFDASYRKNNYVVPFATFVGVNHHKQPVLLGSALIANESKESFTWLFQTWFRAMSRCHPKSIIADQDMAIQQAIAKVFPGTHHRFSLWQIRAKERENFRSMPNEFRYEYEKCVYQSQTTVEFNTTWNLLITKYCLRENIWLKHMYEKRESWVPLYLRGKFFAGIPIGESVESLFGTQVNGQTPLREFISRYEQGLEQSREEERKEDFNSFNLQAYLQTKEPVEEQCRRLYTFTIFKIFQDELLQSYSYIGIKTYEEGAISRYVVRRSGNENDKHAVTFSAVNLSVNCSCQMFEFIGVLCRHVLKVFKLLDMRELPPQYILYRWMRNPEYRILCGAESGISSQELKAFMVWSLRETACKYVECGAASVEKYKLAHEIMREGGKRLC